MIESDEGKSPSMAPLPFLMEKPQEPPKTQVGRSRTIEKVELQRRGEENLRTKENQWTRENQTGEEKMENKDRNDENQDEDQSEDEDSDEIPLATQREFDNISKKIRDPRQAIVDEMDDYKRSVNILHDENIKIIAQLAIVAQRQEIQVQ